MILCLGNFVADVIGKPVERLPEPGTLLPLDTLAVHVGGGGPNCALALARLGVPVAVAGRIGRDLFGRFLREELAAAGVETGPVVVDGDARTGVTLVCVDTAGERSFLHLSGANARFVAEDLDLDELPGVTHLHAASHFVLPAMDGAPLAGLLRAARERGIITSLDTSWDQSGQWMATLAPCLPETDLFMPSETEAEPLSGEAEPERMAAAFHDRGAQAVVIKCGARGCFASANGERFWEPSFQVPVVDTTGAGDCWAAGFLTGHREGWPLRRCLRFANACGALSVGAVGAATAMRPMDEIERWMADNEGGAHPPRRIAPGYDASPAS